MNSSLSFFFFGLACLAYWVIFLYLAVFLVIIFTCFYLLFVAGLQLRVHKKKKSQFYAENFC